MSTIARPRNFSPTSRLTAQSNCASCDLPHWACSRALVVPGFKRWFCSIRCAECFIFGQKRCRWCAQPLGGNAAMRYCDDACRKNSEAVVFGDGTRLLRYIEHHLPDVYCRIADDHRCKFCHSPLQGKRRDADFCDRKCRRRFRLAGAIRPESTSVNNVTALAWFQRLTEVLAGGLCCTP